MRSTLKELNQRRENILKLLAEAPKHQLTVGELAEHFNLSTMTIRRDLDELAELRALERYHGGARLNTKNLSIDGKEHLFKNLNEAISKMAATYIKENDTVFINSSSTALNALRYMDKAMLNIFTNNLNIVNYCLPATCNIVVTGGEVRANRQNALVGDIAQKVVETVSANLCILGCSGLSLDQGISTNNLHEARLNDLYIQQTQGTVILVANHTKINRQTTFKVADLSCVDVFITDRYASNEDVARIEGLGIDVVKA